MQQYHHTSPHRSQAIRIFDLIQQLTSSSSTLNAQVIDKFLKSTNLSCRQDLVKFMHSIDKQNKEMKKQYWGYCISKALENNKVTCQMDYMNLNTMIKSLLMGNYISPLENYQKWDGNNDKNLTEKDEVYARIINICGQLSMFIKKIDFMMFNSNISGINNCFSLITLMPEKKEEIYQIYENILGGNFLETLQFALTMNVSENILIEMLKSLCYLYQSLKYERIRKILQPTFLLQPTTLKGLMQNINDKRPQIRYYTCAMMGLMVNNVRAIADLVLGEKDLLYNLSNGIAQIRQEEGLMYGIQFLIGIIRQFAYFPQAKIDQNKQILSVYLKFAVKKLWQLKSLETQSVCIKLVSETVKVVDLVDQDLKLLKFINNVFEGANEKKFQAFFETSLSIVRNALIFNRKNIKELIIGDKSFQTYLKRILKLGHQEWQPFYSALQIILILAQTQNSDVLFQRDLIPITFQLSQSENGIVQFYLSQILLSLIKNSLESQWKITYLYQKNYLKIIGSLVGKYFMKDIVLFNEYRTQIPISYNNRQVFVNCIKALYFLNSETNEFSTHKKKELYAKNFTNFFINTVSDGFVNYFNTIKNEKYLGTILREEHSIDQNIGQRRVTFIKMLKLMSTVIEQMTLVLRKRNTSLEILKQVNLIRNQFHKNLYRCLTYNELVGENIPIYLIYSAQIDGTVIKQRVYRLSWNEFRSLMWDFIKKVRSIQPTYFKIFDRGTRMEIKNQDDYRRIIQRILLDYNRSNFNVEVAITEIKQQEPTLPMPISGSIRMDQEYRGSMEVPKFMSYRMPAARDVSPYNSRKMGAGSTIQRNPSPNFGTPCQNCRRITTNRSQICNACVQNHPY